MTSTVEFAVEMSCQSCVEKIENTLTNLEGIRKISINLTDRSVVVESNVPSFVIQEKIEATGRKAVLKGLSGTNGKENESLSAVAILGGNIGHSAMGVRGVIRMVQISENVCVVEGTVDGLKPGKHCLHVHEYGDISKGCESVGNHFNLIDSSHGSHSDDYNSSAGDLGNVEAGPNGRAVFRMSHGLFKLEDLIGRSVVITEDLDDFEKNELGSSNLNRNFGKRLACGIISRSAAVFENTKKICACDGRTLWDERENSFSNFQASI